MLQTEIDQNTILRLAEAGVLYGHKKSKTHPKMRPFIGAQRNEIELLKPELIMKKLWKAIEFLKRAREEGGDILLVGTHAAAHEAVDKLAETFGFPYVKTRWLGGTLTNWNSLKSRVKYYLELGEKKEKGELAKYTKKEQVDFAKELEKLRQKFDGLKGMTKLPKALFVIDPHLHQTAVREAKRMGIPIVALMDTNDDPTDIEIPIIGNDHAKASITWVVARIIEGLQKAKIEEHEGTYPTTS